MVKFSFGMVIKVLLITYALLYVFSLVGVIDAIVLAISKFIPDVSLGEVEGIIIPPLASIVALLVTTFGLTLAATAISLGLDDEKMWEPYLILALVTTALFIIVPQVLPGLLKPAAENTASVLMSVFGG